MLEKHLRIFAVVVAYGTPIPVLRGAPHAIPVKVTLSKEGTSGEVGLEAGALVLSDQVGHIPWVAQSN